MVEIQKPSLIIRDAEPVFRLIVENPEAFAAFLKANPVDAQPVVRAMREVGVEMLGDVAAAASVPTTSKLLTPSGVTRPSDIIGKSIIGAGVLLDAQLKAANGNAMPLRVLGFLGSENGNLLRATFNEAIPEITKLNNGLVHGAGTQQDNIRALANDELKPGTIILTAYEAAKELAGTYEQCGRNGRLRTDSALKPMNDIIARGSYDDSWAVSGRETSDNPWNVGYVRLKGGSYGWNHKNYYRGLVVALQCG